MMVMKLNCTQNHKSRFLTCLLHGNLAYGCTSHRWKVNLMARDKTLISDGSLRNQRTQKKEKDYGQDGGGTNAMCLG